MTSRVKPLTDAELDEIRRRCAAATPGPWESFIEGRDHTSGSNFIMTGKGDRRGEDIELSGATAADQDFIAHARQDIPRLLEELDAIRSASAASKRSSGRLSKQRKEGSPSRRRETAPPPGTPGK